MEININRKFTPIFTKMNPYATVLYFYFIGYTKNFEPSILEYPQKCNIETRMYKCGFYIRKFNKKDKPLSGSCIILDNYSDEERARCRFFDNLEECKLSFIEEKKKILIDMESYIKSKENEVRDEMLKIMGMKDE